MQPELDIFFRPDLVSILSFSSFSHLPNQIIHPPLFDANRDAFTLYLLLLFSIRFHANKDLYCHLTRGAGEEFSVPTWPQRCDIFVWLFFESDLLTTDYFHLVCSSLGVQAPRTH